MKNKLVNYFSSITPLSREEADGIAESMQVRSYEKGEYLLREGQIAMSSYFILEGCVREYILNDGEEKTTNFFTEEQWAISLNSFNPQNTSKHNWVCTENTVVVVGDEEQSQKLFKKFPRLETVSRIVMEAVFSEQMEAATSYTTDSPEQRYKKMLDSRPDLFQRIPQYQLASYIGVKPESLSRIRKRIADSGDE